MTEKEEAIKKIMLDLKGVSFSNDDDGYRILNAINQICSILDLNFILRPPK